MSQTTTTLSPDPPRALDSRVTGGGVTIDGTRPRQTEVATSPFRDVLAGGVSVLMGGAAVATHVLGAPQLAAAIVGAQSRATDVITGTPSSGIGNRVLTGTTGAIAGSPAASPTASTAAALPLGGGSDSSDLATMQAMQRESQMFNMQLLGLQEQVQQDNQRFTTLSNVLRAKHDTAKAAVSNIRS
jgi:hypothetical protein